MGGRRVVNRMQSCLKPLTKRDARLKDEKRTNVHLDKLLCFFFHAGCLRFIFLYLIFQFPTGKCTNFAFCSLTLFIYNNLLNFIIYL